MWTETRQRVLSRVALTDPDPHIRKAATERLTDQGILAKVAKSDEDQYTRRTAVERLDNPSVLAQIARADPEAYLREKALNRIASLGGHALDNATSSIVVEIARSDKERNVRLSAIDLMSDQVVLIELARSAGTLWERVHAIDRLVGDDRLARLLEEEVNPEMRRAIVLRMRDPERLLAIVLSDLDGRTVRAAAERLDVSGAIEDQLTTAALACGQRCLADPLELSRFVGLFLAVKRSGNQILVKRSDYVNGPAAEYLRDPGIRLPEVDGDVWILCSNEPWVAWDLGRFVALQPWTTERGGEEPWDYEWTERRAINITLDEVKQWSREKHHDRLAIVRSMLGILRVRTASAPDQVDHPGRGTAVAITHRGGAAINWPPSSCERLDGRNDACGDAAVVMQIYRRKSDGHENASPACARHARDLQSNDLWELARLEPIGAR